MVVCYFVASYCKHRVTLSDSGVMQQSIITFTRLEYSFQVPVHFFTNYQVFFQLKNNSRGLFPPMIINRH